MAALAELRFKLYCLGDRGLHPELLLLSIWTLGGAQGEVNVSGASLESTSQSCRWAPPL